MTQVIRTTLWRFFFFLLDISHLSSFPRDVDRFKSPYSGEGEDGYRQAPRSHPWSHFFPPLFSFFPRLFGVWAFGPFGSGVSPSPITRDVAPLSPPAPARSSHPPPGEKPPLAPTVPFRSLFTRKAVLERSPPVFPPLFRPFFFSFCCTPCRWTPPFGPQSPLGGLPPRNFAAVFLRGRAYLGVTWCREVLRGRTFFFFLFG